MKKILIDGKQSSIKDQAGPVYIITSFVNRYWPYYNRFESVVMWRSRYETKEYGPFQFNYVDIRRYETEEEALIGHEELIKIWSS